MKKLVFGFLSLCLVTMLFTSCSSDVVNNAKISVAEKVKVSVEKELVTAFEGVSIAGVDCKLEAKQHSEFIYDKLAAALKIKSEESAPVMGFASSGSIEKTVCNFVMKEGMQFLFMRIDTPSVCLKELGKEKVLALGDQVCNLL